MKVSLDEKNNKFIIDLQDSTVLLPKGDLLVIDPTMTECDCTPKVDVKYGGIIGGKKITPWSLMFDKDVKRVIKKYNDGIKL